MDATIADLTALFPFGGRCRAVGDTGWRCYQPGRYWHRLRIVICDVHAREFDLPSVPLDLEVEPRLQS